MPRPMPLIRAALLCLATACPAAAQPGPSGTAADPFPKPDRPVAEIVSPRWASERERDAGGEFTEVARLMGIGPGQTVADIGAGDGYYTTRLARRVGATGRVFAEDVMPDYLAGLRARLDRERIANVTLVQGEPQDPRLPMRGVETAILVHMYHEIAQPFGLLSNLAAAMKPGGRIGIVDADAKPERHGTPPMLLRCELAAVQYREVGFHRLKAGGYLAIFEAPVDPPAPGAIRACRDTER